MKRYSAAGVTISETLFTGKGKLSKRIFLFCISKPNHMVSQSIQESLNKQVLMEAESSQAYLAMASWAEIQPGLQGVTDFFYKQSDEERIHMLKLIRFINERGGFAVIPALEQPM